MPGLLLSDFSVVPMDVHTMSGLAGHVTRAQDPQTWAPTEENIPL